MITDLHDHQLEATYDRFVELIGGKPWLKATDDHQRQFATNPLYEFQVTREYRVAYGLAHFDKMGMSLQDSDLWPTVIHALIFAAQVCELAEKGIDENSRGSYIRRVKGAFRNPDDMRALNFEHLTALSLYKQGARIYWPNDSTGPETYDLLVTTQDGVVIEVECKSNSADKGQPITQQEASEFLNRLLQQLPNTPNAGQVLAVKVRVPKRLPRSNSDIDQLVSEVVEALKAGASTTGGDVTVIQQTIEAPMPLASASLDYIQSVIVDPVNEVFGEAEGYRIVALKGDSAICLEVASGRAAKIFDAMWKTAKHAVRNQMTKKRPGCLVMRMEGLRREELIRLSIDNPSPLAVFATKVLIDPRHQHLACIAFISDSDLVKLCESQQSEQSVSFVIEQQVGPYANLGLGRLFRGDIVK